MSFVIAGALAGLLLLFFGGEWLVRGASSLADRLGVSPLAIGLTIVALGTSAPELVVSLQAALAGANDISVGNVVGSNIANIALILGLSACIRPIRARPKLTRIDVPLMILVSAVLLVILADGSASRLEGGVLVLALFVYTGFTFREAPNEAHGAGTPLADGPAVPEAAGSVRAALLQIAAGLAGLVLGAHFLVTSSVTLATRLGMPQAVIGLTLVAVGTSLPELATTLVAAKRGQGDIAIGGVVGSNIFNILGILGLTSLVHPLARGDIRWLDLGTMVGLAVLLLLFLAGRAQLGRIAGGFLLAIFVGFTLFQLVG